jgi:hypothetical protein
VVTLQRRPPCFARWSFPGRSIHRTACASRDRFCMMDASANKMPFSVFALSRFACVDPRGRQAE